jgi:hypothetical protein
MANTFTRKVQKGIGTDANGVQVGSYTVADVSIGTNIPIPGGSTIILYGGDQKLVLEGGDMIKVRSSAATSCDVIMSILEIT